MAKATEVNQAVAVNQALAVNPATPLLPTINLPVLSDKELMEEVLIANTEGGVNIKFGQIKIPSGGITVFEVIDDDGRESTVSEIKGVIVDYKAVKAYWSSEYTGEKNPPDCLSNDGKRGEGEPGGTCNSCVYNEFESDPKGGKGKACKDIINLFILTEGSMLPIRIAIPPGSRKNFEDYINFLVSRVKPYYGVVTAITLTKAVSGGGIKYGQATFNKAADLTALERSAIRSFSNQLKPMMRAVKLDDTIETSMSSLPAASSDGDMWE
jgi:hypothetical protein